MEIAFLVGRVIFGGYFLLNGYSHFAHTASLSGYVASKGVPAPKAAVVLSGLLLAIGGLSIITGYMPLIGIIAILLFLVPVTFTMHGFWKEADPSARMAEKIQFQKNLALAGAALALLAVSVPWAYSL